MKCSDCYIESASGKLNPSLGIVFITNIVISVAIVSIIIVIAVITDIFISNIIILLL